MMTERQAIALTALAFVAGAAGLVLRNLLG